MDLLRRQWHWLRGRAPLGALGPAPVAAPAAWLVALVVGLVVDAASPVAIAPWRTVVLLAFEALLSLLILRAAGARMRLQPMQALGLLAALRNAVLAPVPALLLADAAGATPGVVLVVFLPVALVMVAAMAWLVRRYLDVWQQALGCSRRLAGGALLAVATALLAVEWLADAGGVRLG